MKNLRIAVCSEKTGEAMQLKQMLKYKIPNAEILTFESDAAFLRTFEDNVPGYDLIFLGIPEKSPGAMETARRVREENIFYPIVLICDIDKYYREAFEVLAFTYLSRPLNAEQLEEVLHSLMVILGKRLGKIVHFQYRSQVYSLPHYRIAYISSSLHTVIFHLINGKTLSCRGKLNDFKEQFEGSLIVRCHQSFFVNLEQITAMKNDSCIVDGTLIPISRAYSKQVQVCYRQYLASIGQS